MESYETGALGERGQRRTTQKMLKWNLKLSRIFQLDEEQCEGQKHEDLSAHLQLGD